MSLAAVGAGSAAAVLALTMALDGGPRSQAGPRPAGASARAIAITNVTVIDVVSGAKQAGVTVVAKGGEIAAVGRSVPVPRGAVRVDGSGKFLIPGLWDR
jgi:hypothetical protein